MKLFMYKKQLTSILLLISFFLLVVSASLAIKIIDFSGSDTFASSIATNNSPKGTIQEYYPQSVAKLASGKSAKNYILVTSPNIPTTRSISLGNNTVMSKPMYRLNTSRTYRNNLYQYYQMQFVVKGTQLIYRNNQNGWSAWDTKDTLSFRSVGSGAFGCLNIDISNQGLVKQHLVRGNKIWYRELYTTKGSWSDVTANVNSVGSGTITCFNTLTKGSGYESQHLVRGGKVWYQENLYGWSNWQDVTTNVQKVGTGTITAFSVYEDPEGYLVQHLTMGGKVYTRNNKSGWSSWSDVTSNIPSTIAGSIISFQTDYIRTNTAEFTWTYNTPSWSSDVILLNEQELFQKNNLPLSDKLPYTTKGYTANYIDKRKIQLSSKTLTNTQLQGDPTREFKNWMIKNGVDNGLYPHTFTYKGK